MPFQGVAPWITIGSLVAALAVFVLRLTRRPRRRPGAVDFGAGFSAFVAGWIATELLAMFAPADWLGAEEILHFAVLGLFAAWMNVRFRWALRQAREG